MRVSRSLNYLPEADAQSKLQVEIFQTYFDTLPDEVLRHISGINNPSCQFKYKGRGENELHVIYGELDIAIRVDIKNNPRQIERFIDCLEKNEESDLTINPFISIGIRDAIIPFLHGLSIIEFKNTPVIRQSLIIALKDFASDIRGYIQQNQTADNAHLYL